MNTRELILRYQEDTGDTNRQISEDLMCSTRTFSDWKSGKTEASGYLHLALNELRRQKADRLIKKRITGQPKCAYCGLDIEIKELQKGQYRASHVCKSGLRIQSPVRTKEEVFYALTETIKEMINV